ncbi:MAG TPA: glycosyltransferase [Gemmatimonadaceae bacterium]|nr:glycosyltransferase [Gemmatimonadaceae bacterium]
MPRVTVLMPVYNGERFIAEAAESVLSQTYGAFELLVVDDGSTDGTRDVLASVKDPRLIVVHNEANVGLARTLNRGLSLARGEYVAHHDADDVSEPMRLIHQVSHLDADSSIALVGSDYTKIDEASAWLGDRSLPVEPAHIAWALAFYCPIVHSAVTYRRRVVLDVGGYDVRYAYSPDYDLWSRLAANHRLASVRLPLVRYRIRHDSLTATIGESSGEGRRVAVRNATALLAFSGRTLPDAAEHQAMHGVVTGTEVPEDGASIAVAFERILHMLDAFCLHPVFSAAETLAVRADVRLALSRRLVDCIDRFDAATFARLRSLVSGDDPWFAILAALPLQQSARVFWKTAMAQWTERHR